MDSQKDTGSKILKILLAIFLGIVFFYIFQLSITKITEQGKKKHIKIVNGLWDTINQKVYKNKF